MLAAAACSTAPSSAAPPPQLTPYEVTLSASSFQPRSAGAVFFGSSWRITDAAPEVYAPLAVPVGCTITGWTAHAIKGTVPSLLTAGLQYVVPTSSIATLVGGAEEGAIGIAGDVVLSPPSVSHVVLPRADYSIRIARDLTPGADQIFAADLAYGCP